MLDKKLQHKIYWTLWLQHGITTLQTTRVENNVCHSTASSDVICKADFHILPPAVFLQCECIGATWYIPKSIFVSDFHIVSIYQCIENSEGRSIHVHTGHTNTSGIRMWNAGFWRCVLISNKDLWHATDMCQHVQHKIRADIKWFNTFHVFQRNHKFLLSAMFVIGIFVGALEFPWLFSFEFQN